MVDEAKTKTFDQKPPEGTPPGKAGDEQGKEKLYAGKYKTIEDWEKGTKDLEEKLRTQGEEKNTAISAKEAADKRVSDLLDQQKKVDEAQTEEQKKIEEDQLEKMGLDFSESFKKGPKEGMRALYNLIETHPSVASGLKRTSDMETERKQAVRQKTVFSIVAAKHPDDWKELTPRMKEIFNAQSLLVKQNPDEELLETIYYRAKGEVAPTPKTPEEILKEAAEREKAGTGQGTGSGEVIEEKKDRVDDIIEQRKKDNTMGSIYNK